MRQEAYFCTVKELDELGKNNIPQQLISHTHLIYSSPATLAFNSPGAEGFGVKRAGLAVPDSIMLIVSPGCCGIYRKYLYPYQGSGNNGKVCKDAGKIWRVFRRWNKDRNGNGCNEIYQEE